MVFWALTFAYLNLALLVFCLYVWTIYAFNKWSLASLKWECHAVPFRNELWHLVKGFMESVWCRITTPWAKISHCLGGEFSLLVTYSKGSKGMSKAVLRFCQVVMLHLHKRESFLRDMQVLLFWDRMELQHFHHW